jgi:hypothetical protein
MRIFIDESGDFGWQPPQISLHCSLIVPGSSLVELYRRHFEWKKSILGEHRKLEIKANTLTDQELQRFVEHVILPERHLKVTVVGIDTRQVPKQKLEDWRDSVSLLSKGASSWSHSQNLPIAARQYNEMSGWLWNRSPQNFALIISLGEAIWTSLQWSILLFHEAQFESEFEDFDIVLDRGFIKTPEHELFWREFLRNHLRNVSRRKPLGVPMAWNETNHFFERKYAAENDEVDMTELFREHLYFFDSKKSEGLQIADICANICLRYHRHEQWFPAYSLLREFIVGEDGRPMTTLVPTGELDLDAEAPTKRQTEVLQHAKGLPRRKRK